MSLSYLNLYRSNVCKIGHAVYCRLSPYLPRSIPIPNPTQIKVRVLLSPSSSVTFYFQNAASHLRGQYTPHALLKLPSIPVYLTCASRSYYRKREKKQRMAARWRRIYGGAAPMGAARLPRLSPNSRFTADGRGLGAPGDGQLADIDCPAYK